MKNYFWLVQDMFARGSKRKSKSVSDYGGQLAQCG